MWLINKASHSEELGTVYASTNYLSLELEYSPRVIRTIIDVLVSDKVIDKVTTKLPTKFATKLIICDFDTYNTSARSSRQSSRQSSDKVRGRVKDTNAADKDVKEPNVKAQESVVIEEVVQKTQREVEFERFNLWVDKEVPLIRKMKEQLSIEQFSHLLDEVKIPKEVLALLIRELGNKEKYVKEHSSVNLTIQNWYRRDQQKQNYGFKTSNTVEAAKQRLTELLEKRAADNARKESGEDNVPLF